MDTAILTNTIQQLFANGRGLLAMDESTGTCNKRFAAAGIAQTVEMRRQYRELIITTGGLSESIGGAILFDETIRQQTKDGISFTDVLQKAGIIPGIKCDMGAVPMAGFPLEKITEGLDGLRERLDQYKKMGARFAKWRAVIAIDNGIPTLTCIDANMHALARYASICQEADIVPIVEPEILMDGNHSLQNCFDTTALVLQKLFGRLYEQRIALGGMILKPNMVIAGTNAAEKNTVEEVAEATVRCLLQHVPAAVPAIAFLSGGQSPDEASAHLNAMNKIYQNRLPWIVSFSFARAIQQPAMDAWKGHPENITAAQQLLYKYAKNAADARNGEWEA